MRNYSDNEMFAPGVQMMRCHWGRIFSDTAEALIACGVAQTDRIPADRKQRKLTVDGRTIKVRKASKYCFDVWVEYLPEEEEQYHLDVKKDRELKAEEERLDGEEKHLANLPTAVAEYRAKTLATVNAFSDWPIAALSWWNQSGFRYDEATIVELKRLIDEIQFCLQHGRVVFDPAVQADTFARHKAARAKADPNFQALMARLKRPSKLPE